MRSLVVASELAASSSMRRLRRFRASVAWNFDAAIPANSPVDLRMVGFGSSELLCGFNSTMFTPLRVFDVTPETGDKRLAYLTQWTQSLWIR